VGDFFHDLDCLGPAAAPDLIDVVLLLFVVSVVAYDDFDFAPSWDSALLDL